MFLARLFGEFLLEMGEVVGPLEGKGVPIVESTDPISTQEMVPTGSGSSSKQERAPENEQYEPNNSQDSEVAYQPKGDDTQRISQELNDQNGKLHEEIVGHLRWQDRATQTIGDLKDQMQDLKEETSRATGNLERQVKRLGAEKLRIFDEKSRTIEAREKSLREMEAQLDHQKEAAEQAAAVAEDKITRAEAKHHRNTPIIEIELETLQTRIDHRDSEIKLLRDEASDARQAMKVTMDEKNDLYHAKLQVDDEIKRLKAKNLDLDLARKEVELKVSGLEGSVKGLAALLKTTEKTADQWEEMYNEAQEAARDKLLGAYDIENSEEKQQSKLIVEMRKEKSEMEDKNRVLAARTTELAQALEQAKRDQSDQEKEIRRQCEEQKKEALAEARAKEDGSSAQAATEQDIRRECQEEKEKELAQQHDQFCVQWKIREDSLRAQLAARLKSQTRDQLRKSRRRTSTESNLRSKVKKSTMKGVVKHAVSCALDLERPVMETRLRNQFEREASDYKTQLKTGLTGAQTQELATQKANLIQANKQKVIMTQEFQQASRLLAELAGKGLDDFHRGMLAELLAANEMITDLRSVIEDDDYIDTNAFIQRIEVAMKNSDDFEDFDSQKRPTLHARVLESYTLMGSLYHILETKSGDSLKADLLERINRDKVKGKEKQGTISGPSAASVSSIAPSGGRSAAPSPPANVSHPAISGLDNNQQTDSQNTTPSTNSQSHDMNVSASTPNPGETPAQNMPVPDEMDSATAHAMQGLNETGLGTLIPFDIETIDWNDPMMLNFDTEAEWPSSQNPGNASNSQQ